jgi:hypothetical protein
MIVLLLICAKALYFGTGDLNHSNILSKGSFAESSLYL